jgi:hypothetical protein
MRRLTLDPMLMERLNGLTEHIELCDETGQTVGHFLPTSVYEDLFFAALASESPHSKEELRRRYNETGGRSLAEIWKSLGRSD